MQRFRFTWVVLLAVACLVTPAEASAAAKRVALVIGNSAYQHTAPLANPMNDATDMAAKLAGLGFDVTLGLDLTEDRFGDVVAEFAAKLSTGADVALLFYAGHGVQFGGVNYLVPIDARLEDEFRLKRETVALSDIIHEMELQARTNLVFLDACRNNPLGERLRKSMISQGRSASVGRGLARVDSSSPDTLITFAAAPGAEAADGTGRNSPFTAALLENIDTPGVEIEVLLKRVTAAVREATRGMQQPERLSKLTIEFYFAGGDGQSAAAAAPAAPSTRSEAAEAWDAVKGSTDRAVLEAFVARFGDSFFATLARSRIAALEAESQQQVAVATPPDLALEGEYTAKGRNPNGSRYTGRVTIARQGDGYRFHWRIGKQQFHGTGTLAGRVLTVDWGQTDPVIYDIETNGVLRGVWARGQGSEELFPVK